MKVEESFQVVTLKPKLLSSPKEHGNIWKSPEGFQRNTMPNTMLCTLDFEGHESEWNEKAVSTCGSGVLSSFGKQKNIYSGAKKLPLRDRADAKEPGSHL